MPRHVEILAPARDLRCGIEAVRHGADAVYIGAPRFGARAAAGNAVEDIAELVRFAHPYGVRIYVTLNTLLRDDELPEARQLMLRLAEAGVDALITQDPRLAGAPLPLHASTQQDNRTPDDVRRRREEGYAQTVLARELSLQDIRAIHDAVPDMPLEAFVHGALCVSYSGRCHASAFCFGRSADRGECAQFCRLPFDLVDATGRVVALPPAARGAHAADPAAAALPATLRQLHLLSLRDMNRSADLEAMLDAGISSFKIEGRLKDVAYVKNITAHYRRLLDGIMARRPADFCRASHGHTTLAFTPDPARSFNRGFTDYFLHGRSPKPLFQPLTPKSLGQPVGRVKDVRPQASLAVAGTAAFANGDGLCFFAPDGRLVGFRVNRVDAQGRLWPADAAVLAALRPGTPLFRNFDARFEHLLARPSADRRIGVRWSLREVPAAGAPAGEDVAFSLALTAENGVAVVRIFSCPCQPARTPQADAVRRQLLRLGDTPFAASEADVDLQLPSNWFLPASTLAQWRRQLTAELALRLAPQPVAPRPAAASPQPAASDALHPSASTPQSFASDALHPSASTPQPSASEALHPSASTPQSFASDALHPSASTPQSFASDPDAPLMMCRHCLRHALGYCTRRAAGRGEEARAPWREPLALRLADGRTFPLRFDCRRCEMHVLRPES